jgi:hypothetical protein
LPGVRHCEQVIIGHDTQVGILPGLNVNAGHPMSIGFLRGPDRYVLLPSIENEYLC